MGTDLLKRHLGAIRKNASLISKKITLMEICGGHTNTIMQYGIREILPKNVRLISGPGCPVCVSSAKDIDCMIELAMNKIPVATYGDMMRVPGSRYSLDDARAMGGRVFEVYSTTDVLQLKKTYQNIVFFGIGFETTAPMTTLLLKNSICVYSVHKLVPPAIDALMQGEVAIDGFILPGHVSTIIGTAPYRRFPIPQAVAGFTPERIMRAISVLVELIAEERKDVINAYPEAVREQGNQIAQNLLGEHFNVEDSQWRGLGTIPSSGLGVRDERLDAKQKYREIISKVPEPKKTTCRCGDVLKGTIEPPECPLYKISCTPDDPKGACMVSSEGSCAISYRHAR